jgi:endo-1,4-beta-D-glucanase Y
MKKSRLLPALAIFSLLLITIPAAHGAIMTFQTTYGNGIQQADDPTLVSKYNQWVSWFVTTNGAGGYRRVHYVEGVGGQGDGTASEGIGYGLVLAVYFNDQTLFNDLWNYKVNHSPNKAMMGWLINSGGGVQDSNSATDGDSDIAMALILANRRWGSAGTFNYNSLATQEVQKVGSNDVDPVDFHIFPGDYCSHASNDNTYPSYFTPAWYTEFGAQTGNATMWASVLSKAYTMLAACRNGSTGLAPEECTAGGSAAGTQDSYNSERIPFRYSLDYLWNGNANNSLTQINLDNAFFAGKATTVGATYNITGGNPTDTTHNGSRVGPVGTSFMVAGHTGDLTAYYTEASSAFNDGSHFYNSTLALLSLLEMSGNMPRYFGPQPPTPTPKPGDIFDECEDGDNVNDWGGYWYTYDDSASPNLGNSLVVPWTDAHWAKVVKTPTPFYMMAPGYPGSGYGTVFGARMTGNVTTTYQYGFVGMGSGMNPDSGSPTYKKTDLTVYTGFRFWVKTVNATDKYNVKITCPTSVTNPAGNDFKLQFVGSTTWSHVDVPFTALTQENWGTSTVYVSKTLVLQNATDLQWQTATQPMANVDIMVDDIEFYPALPPTATPTYCVGQKLDDLEDGDNTNEFGGYWYTYANSTPSASTVWPAAGMTFTASAPGANGSLFCARITGTVSAAAVPFVGMGSNMLVSGAARDLSMFVGITFWIKGDGNLYSVKLKADPTVITGGNEFKYTFRSEPAANGWDQMTVPFSIFTQERGWGTVVTLASVLTKLQQIQWESKGPSHTVDLSIDDVYFECSQGWTPTATRTSVAPTNTVTPTWTSSPVMPSSTFTPTRTNTPTMTPTITRTATPTFTVQVPTNTFTPLGGPSSTNTPIVPSSTNTPSLTNTPIAPSSTNTPIVPSSTNTPLAPSATNTPVDTNTQIVPSNTNTPLVPSATNTPLPTDSPILPSPTFTNTVNTSLPVDVLIDDCNDGDNTNLLGGYWYAFDDAGSGLSYTDPVSDNRAIADGIPTVAFSMKGYDHTTNAYGGAAKITGAVKDIPPGFIYGFVGMGTNLNKDKTPMNIGCCSGIRFYARSTSGTMTQFRMKLAHPTAFTPANNSENMFGFVFNVTASWQLIDIPLSTLTQLPYWGTTIPLASALAVTEAIQFQSTAPDGTDVPSLALEVDDLTLYNCVGGCMPTPVPTVVIPPTQTITPTPNVALTDFLLDDCTDDNNANNLGGYWYTFDDASTTVTHSYVWPMSDKWGVVHAVPTYAFVMSAPGNGGTGYAAQMTGTTTNDLGYDFIGMGTNLSEPKAPMQLNCCGGIRFYAKSDTPGVMSTFRVKIGAGGAYTCGDGGDMYGKVITVTGTWQLFDIPFASMTAEGWGAAQCPPQPSLAQALAKADSIQFQSTAQSKAGIDLWVDDLYLTKCYPGCVNAVIPTPSNTPNVPQPTLTNTPNIPPTASPTNVPPGSSPTNTPTTVISGADTPTATATATPADATQLSNTFGFVLDKDKNQVIAAWPNPAPTGWNSPITIGFQVTKGGLTSVKIRIYTSGMRLIREATASVGSGNSELVSGISMNANQVSLSLKAEAINSLSKGTYYYVLEIKDSTNTVTSQVQKILKLN